MKTNYAKNWRAEDEARTRTPKRGYGHSPLAHSTVPAGTFTRGMSREALAFEQMLKAAALGSHTTFNTPTANAANG